MAAGSNARSRDARAKAAELVRQQKARDRRRRLIAVWSGIAVAVVVGVVVAGVIIGNARPNSSAAANAVPTAAPTVAHGAESAPPWNAPADPTTRAKAAGLQMLSAEGTVEHIHSHLTVTVDGAKVAVPALLGIDESAGSISPLHTHDASGIVHVESPVATSFTLGQVFTEWNVALATNRIGSYSTADGRAITVFVDRKPYTGDPAAITLADHEDIDIVVTRAGVKATAPAAFTWPAGY